MSGQEFKTVPATPGLDVYRKVDQSALDGFPTGFCVCRADGALVRYNRRAIELWGLTPPLEDSSVREGPSFRRYGADGAPLSFDSTPVAIALRTGQAVAGAELVI
jgi:PAS domain-containing protein